MLPFGAAPIAREKKGALCSWGFCRIGPSENFDESTPERPFFVEKMSQRAPSQFGPTWSPSQ